MIDSCYSNAELMYYVYMSDGVLEMGGLVTQQLLVVDLHLCLSNHTFFCRLCIPALWHCIRHLLLPCAGRWGLNG